LKFIAIPSGKRHFYRTGMQNTLIVALVRIPSKTPFLWGTDVDFVPSDYRRSSSHQKKGMFLVLPILAARPRKTAVCSLRFRAGSQKRKGLFGTFCAPLKNPFFDRFSWASQGHNQLHPHFSEGSGAFSGPKIM